MTHEPLTHADALLQSWGMSFHVNLIGSACPPFCDDALAHWHMGDVDKYPRRTHIHGKHYRTEFIKADGETFSVDYWNSYADEEFNALRHKGDEKKYKPWRRSTDGALGLWRKTPTAYDVLACLQKYPPGTFSAWCREFGYDDDSIHAESTWRAVCDEFERMARFFTSEQMEQLREID